MNSKLFEWLSQHREGRRVQNYGLGGVAFACSMVIVGYSGEDVERFSKMQEALRYFIVALPLLLGAPALEETAIEKTSRHVSQILIISAVWAHVIGQVLVIFGLYAMFVNVSEPHAKLFVYISIGAYILILLVRLALK